MLGLHPQDNWLVEGEICANWCHWQDRTLAMVAAIRQSHDACAFRAIKVDFAFIKAQLSLGFCGNSWR